MPNPRGPAPFDNFMPLVDPKTGVLTDDGLNRMHQLWRQGVAGFPIIPCIATQASPNVINLTATLNEEGSYSYADGLTFYFQAVATTTGAVTAVVKNKRTSLSTLPVFKNFGLTAAGAADITINGCYFLTCQSTLNAGAGGFVLK